MCRNPRRRHNFACRFAVVAIVCVANTSCQSNERQHSAPRIGVSGTRYHATQWTDWYEHAISGATICDTTAPIAPTSLPNEPLDTKSLPAPDEKPLDTAAPWEKIFPPLDNSLPPQIVPPQRRLPPPSEENQDSADRLETSFSPQKTPTTLQKDQSWPYSLPPPWNE